MRILWRVLSKTNPSRDLSRYLLSLWYDAKGDWHRAHDVAQGIADNLGSWIHAYLHRKEGDDWNARYWYDRATKPFPGSTIQDEWEDLLQFFLKGHESARDKS